MQRKPNSRRKPKSPRDDATNTCTLQGSQKTDRSQMQQISKILSTQDSSESTELFQMQCFPPFFPINSKPKLSHSFNPLSKQTKHTKLGISPYDLEELDKDILQPAVLNAFIKKIQRTQPLFDIDELLQDVEIEKSDFEEFRKDTTQHSPGKMKESHAWFENLNGIFISVAVLILHLSSIAFLYVLYLPSYVNVCRWRILFYRP